MIAGGLAIRDAVAEDCTRDGSLRTAAVANLGASFSAPPIGGQSPWLDDPSKRPATLERTGEVVGR
ncbi:MAG: hypothetical protein AB1749_06780 [Pseudomonadota bacterium]